jgi:hypothetical protein
LGQTTHISVLFIDTFEVKIRTVLRVHLSKIGQSLEEVRHTTAGVALPSPLLILVIGRTRCHRPSAGPTGIDNGIV